MIYLDNAATSFPKPRCVIRDLNSCLKKYCGNPGRSSHKLSLQASEAIYAVREEIAEHLSISTPENVVFTLNATYALNLAIKTFINEKCHILTSDFEHNSVIRPLEALKRRIGIEYSSFSTDGDVEKSIKESIRADTKGIVASVASNVTGDSISLKILSKIAAEYNLFLIVDASQAIGHTKIDLKETPCDVLCAPAHKALFGIQGCGFAVFKDSTPRDSFIEGGSGSESVNPLMPVLLPERYEAGTLPTPAIVALGSGLKYIKDIGIENIEARLTMLTSELEARLAEIPDVKIYKSGTGIVSFNVADYPSSLVAGWLDKNGICTRGGLHCAPSIHKKLGTLEQGAVRISLSYLNSKSDIDGFYRVMKCIRK